LRPSLTEVEDLVTRARSKKNEEGAKQKPKTDELRQEMRAQVSEIRLVNHLRILDLRASLQAAQEKAIEQTRKLKEESAAKERREAIRAARDDARALAASAR